MQAPKVTLFDGQFATISDQTQRPFVISITPVVGDFAVAQQPVIVVLNEGTQLNVQGIVSDDKRFVRLTLVPFFSQIGAVDTFTFEGRRSARTSSRDEEDTNGDGVVDEKDAVDYQRYRRVRRRYDGPAADLRVHVGQYNRQRAGRRNDSAGWNQTFVRRSRRTRCSDAQQDPLRQPIVPKHFGWPRRS